MNLAEAEPLGNSCLRLLAASPSPRPRCACPCAPHSLFWHPKWATDDADSIPPSLSRRARCHHAAPSRLRLGRPCHVPRLTRSRCSYCTVRSRKVKASVPMPFPY